MYEGKSGDEVKFICSFSNLKDFDDCIETKDGNQTYHQSWGLAVV